MQNHTLYELLLSGYIKQCNLNTKTIVPSEILDLCIIYHSQRFIKIGYYDDIFINDWDVKTIKYLLMDQYLSIFELYGYIVSEHDLAETFKDEIAACNQTYTAKEYYRNCCYQMVRIYGRFKDVKSIYTVNFKGKMVVSPHEIEEQMKWLGTHGFLQADNYENEWMEIPLDYRYCRQTMSDFDIDNEYIPEYMIEIRDSKTKQFKKQSHDPSLKKLKIGDIIDCKDTQEYYYESFVRYVKYDSNNDVEKIVVHFCNWHPKWAEWIAITDDRMAARNSNTIGPYWDSARTCVSCNRFIIPSQTNS
eukprot:550115_1